MFSRLCRLPLLPAVFLFATAGAVASDDIRVYEIAAADSEIRVLVYRGGLLKGLGHNHVVHTKGLQGQIRIADAPEAASFEFSFPVDSLIVDDPDVRRQEGDEFPGEIPDKDIKGTRDNMLGNKLLQAERFEDISIESRQVAGATPELSVRAAVTVRNVTRTIEFPVTVSLDGDRLVAEGATTISHAEIGLSPFRAALGALKVADEMRLKYRIVALQR